MNTTGNNDLCSFCTIFFLFLFMSLSVGFHVIFHILFMLPGFETKQLADGR